AHRRNRRRRPGRRGLGPPDRSRPPAPAGSREQRMTAAAPAIRLRHLTHRFGSSVAVDDLSLDVPSGEIFGFIGPNGAGKTTTIRVMATLLEPSAGKVEIDGIDAVEDPVGVRRALGYMPDHAGVYERITVREYLEFFAAAAGVKGNRAIDASVELTNLGDLQEIGRASCRERG